MKYKVGQKVEPVVKKNLTTEKQAQAIADRFNQILREGEK